MTGKTAPSRAAGCAICGKPVHPDYRPFCSRRCADVDLQRWLVGAYVVPGEAAEDDDRPPPMADESE